jgi:UDP-N-acetylmuramoylalanine--D-glutamate ligase
MSNDTIEITKTYQQKVEEFKNKKVLIVGLGKTGFKLIHFFNALGCEIKFTDIKPFHELHKQIKKLKKIFVNPMDTGTFGMHANEDFEEADIVVYSSSVHPELPQLEKARSLGKLVFSEFALGNHLCDKEKVAICGSTGRTTVAHMIGHALKIEGKNVFVCGSSETPFIDYATLANREEIDYIVVEVSAVQLKKLNNFEPKLVLYTEVSQKYDKTKFKSFEDYLQTKFSLIYKLKLNHFLILNFDKMANHSIFKNLKCQVYWYSRKSFVSMGVYDEVSGTHFHERRIHSNIHCHSEMKVNKMRIIGSNNRENLLAAITVCKALEVSDKAIQTTIEKFPGIPHRLEFVTEKNDVKFYNDSKSEKMEDLLKSIAEFNKNERKASYKKLILIAGGKDNETDYTTYADTISDKVKVLVLVGECKEKMNRELGDDTETYLVGSFEESVLLAYQKSSTGDVVLLSPGNGSNDFFRDYEERGNYFKKLIYQL